jgi:predicted metalloprotease with PDZ domain
LPIELDIKKSENFYAITSLAHKSSPLEETFTASSYHELVDNPIMFSEPDTTSFMVANCRVTIGVYNESGRKISKDIYKEIEKSMNALAKFFDNQLPVNNYSFIIYLRDYTEYLPTLEGKEIGLFDILKLVKNLKGQGFGALEHGNSSVYFLPDFGNDLAVKQMKDVCTHEFLHILTPLNLHSECIGNFNYADPKMSKHLWLYEGITEYFAGLALTQGGVQTPWDYLNKTLVGKIKTAGKYPFTKMSFTEMSENVFVEPYKAQYGQVYERGALLGALLDIEIISLTNGQKTLKDVVMTLSKSYGKNNNFSEANFISEFVAASHPGMQTFFDKYITGKDTLAISEILAKAGVDYKSEYKGMTPVSPYKDVDFKRITLGNKRAIKSVSKKDKWGFKEGDLVESSLVKKYALTEFGYMPDGEIYTVEV